MDVRGHPGRSQEDVVTDLLQLRECVCIVLTGCRQKYKYYHTVVEGEGRPPCVYAARKRGWVVSGSCVKSRTSKPSTWVLAERFRRKWKVQPDYFLLLMVKSKRK